MFCGVFVYSLTVGSVSATLSRSDKKNKEFNEKMEVLLSIQNQYKIGSKLFFKIKNQLKYGKASNFINFIIENFICKELSKNSKSLLKIYQRI